MANTAIYCCCGPDCEEALVPDPYCDDLTPATMELTVSLVSICESCAEISTGNWTKVVSGTINGVHTLTSTTPLLTDWGVEYTDLFVVGSYGSESDCNDDTGSEYDADVTIKLWKHATTWQLQIRAILDLGGGTTTDALIFCGSVTATTDGGDQVCASMPSMGNDLSTCANLGFETNCPDSSADAFAIATGGTATAVCV